MGILGEVKRGVKKVFGSGGESESERFAKDAARKTEEMMKRLEKINLDDKKIEELLSKRAETLPELAGLYEALQEDPGLLERIKADPRFGEIARENLEKVQEIVDEGGFTEEDMAKFREADRMSKAQTAATLKSIDRQAMERGAGPSSGVSYAAKQLAAQNEANRAASRADQIAMQAAERRRAAMGQAADMAQSQEAQQFRQMATRAGATDQRTQRNLQGRQTALDRNLGLRQQLENLKAQNQASYYDAMAQLEQQKFSNELAKVQGLAQLQNQANQYRMAGAKPKKNKAGFMGGLIGAGLGATLAASGMGPQGAAIGYQIGSSAGNYFGGDDGGVKYNDGGVNTTKAALERLANRPSVDFKQKYEPPREVSAADQIAAFNAMQRQNKAYQEGGVQQTQKEEPKVSNNDSKMLDVITSLANNINDLSKPRARYEDGGFSNMNSALVTDSTKDEQTTESIAQITGAEPPTSTNIVGSYIGSKQPSQPFGGKFGKVVNSQLGSNQTGQPFGGKFGKVAGKFLGRFEDGGVSGNESMSEDKILKLKQDLEAQKKQKDKMKAMQHFSSLLDQQAKKNDAIEEARKKLFNQAAKEKLSFEAPENLLPKATPLAGIQANDGAVKMSPDDMRDMLLSEINKFACGGVKHGKKYEEGGVDSIANLRRMEDNLDTQALREEIEFENALRREEEADARAAELSEYIDGGITPELREATQMLRKNNQPAPASPMPGGQPPMPAAPIDPNMMPPMAPPMDPSMLPLQGAPMPPQGQMMADGGMAYEDGGEGTIIPGESFEGDKLPDRINSGEMVLNAEQQDRLNDQLLELKRLKSKERTDKMLADGTAEVNPEQQEAIMAFVRGEIDIDELPNERVVKEPSVGEPTGRMAELLGMLGKKKRG